MAENPRIKPIEKATGRPWAEWLEYMDSIDAKQLNHHEIATKVFEQLDGKLENPGWWAQAVTVAYEQHIGKRVPGQQSDGSFQASISRATKLEMKELMGKWESFAANDKEVLTMIEGEVRVGGTQKRMSWRAKAPDGSAIIILSEPKAGGSASIVLQIMSVKTQRLSAEAKAKWAQVLSRFMEKL